MGVVEFSADAWQASSPGLQSGLAKRMEAVHELAQGLQVLAASEKVRGLGADGMRAYIREVHGPILRSLLIGLSTFQTAVGVYWNGYAQVDTGGNFWLVRDELQAHLTQLGAGMGTLQDVAAELRTIAGDASHLVSLGGAGAVQAERTVEDLGRMHAIVKGQLGTWEAYEASDHGFAQVQGLIAELRRVVNNVGSLTVGRGRSYMPGSFALSAQGLGALTAGMVEYCQAHQDAATKGWTKAFEGFQEDLEAAEKARREQAGWDLLWDGLQVLTGAVVTVIGLGLTPFTAGSSLFLTGLGAAMVVGGINNGINHYSIATTGREFNLAGMAATWIDTNVAKPVAAVSPFTGGLISGAGHALTGLAQLSVKDTAVGVSALITDQAARDALWNQLIETGAKVISGDWYRGGQIVGELAGLIIPGAVVAKAARAAGLAGKAGELANGLAQPGKYLPGVKPLGAPGTVSRKADEVQALKSELMDATRAKNFPGYDPTGGLGWDGFLEKYLKGFDGEGRPRWNWPDAPPHTDGFVNGVSKPADLVPGDVLERITFRDNDGNLVDGDFAAPPETSFEKLSLPPDRLGDNATTVRYEIVKPVPDNVRMGDIAPGFEQPGLGTQYHFPDGVQELIDQGYVREVP
ncbi:glycohydrolase toxin TNT-related protein [Leifsonia sp. Leaf336]|uniref:glycohydrolase toxin TNT-related protein n=1 Tax=Leifsonia sp. Leaf336 TaxID=1736341 RepID=UPI001F460967|nr:glycohydrolase toxin TNT-related protein [Leifsonia sp. Leaf336]